MGFLDWFKSTPENVTVHDDKIWLSKQAKLNGMAKALLQRLDEQDRPDAVILVAHFQDSLDELQQIAENVGASDLVTVTTAGMLRKNAAFCTSFDPSRTVEIVVGERHPLQSHDENVLAFVRSLPCRCRLVYHVSLEDPLMRAFCGEWVETVLKRLGMAEDEAIDSNLVARRIKAAQKKIAKQCVSESPADSAELWMERNCPEMVKGKG
jgi:hypothetical protein